MQKFTYSAVNAEGETVQGEIEAIDRSSATGQLRSRGFYPTGIKQARAASPDIWVKKVRLTVMATFCQQLSAILMAGVPLINALDIMKRQEEDRMMRRIIADVYESLLRGRSMTESFASHAARLPLLFINMVEAGEASGTLDECLARAGEAFVSQNRINRKVMGALTYPMVLIVMMLAMLVVMLVAVIPQFVEIFEKQGAELPALTVMLITVSDFMRQRWYIPLGALIALVILIHVLLRTDGGRLGFDRMKLKLPLIGKQMLKIAAARYARTLATLSSSGLPLTQALEVTGRAVQNRWLKKNIERVSDAVRNGEGMSGPLEQLDFLPPMITHMTRLGEESGSLESLLEKTAQYYEEESEAAMQRLTSLLEPAIIVVMGIVIALVLSGVILPVFNLAGAI